MRSPAFELLAEAGRIFLAPLEEQGTALERLTELLAAKLGDVALLELATALGEGAHELRRVARAASTPLGIARLATLRQVYTVDLESAPAHGPAHVLRAGAAEMTSDVDETWLRGLSPDPTEVDVFRGLELGSMLLVPLKARGATLGVLVLARRRESPPWSLAELALVEELAARTALVVDNANLHRDALEAIRTREELIATLSHELRTPLNAILGWSHVLRTRPQDELTLARALETIERNARSEAQLVDDILDVSRLASGQLHLELAEVHLPDVVRRAAELLGPAAAARDVHLELHLESSVAPLTGDPARLQQVVWHLLSNAIKFSRPGDVVEVVLDASEGHALLVVRDHGDGIPASFLPHVFEPFRQADGSPTRRHGGLGIGLALVRHVIELHGGTVRADSEGPGRGATFTVHLPLSRKKPAASAAPWKAA